MNNKSSNQSKLFKGKSTSQGNIAAITIIVVIAITIVLNLIVGKLTPDTLQIDMTNGKIYSVSDTSKDFLKNLDQDIDLYFLANGETDERIIKFAYNYASYSDHIKIHEIDAVSNPSYITKFNCSLNSLVVNCESSGKKQIISYTGLSDALILYSYTQNEYGQYSTYESAFDADGQITGAINYCISDASETIYALTGHGEAEIPTGAIDMVTKSNVAYSEAPVDILMSGTIPDDCSMLICYAPTTDLSSDELELIDNYLHQGGNFLIVGENTETELANFNKLFNEYGLNMLDGSAGDSSRYFKQYAPFYGYYCFAPVLAEESEITAGIKTNVVMLYASAMEEIEPARETITVHPFMTTSANGILVDKDENVTPGTYILGATSSEIITKENGETVKSNLTVISSISFINDSITSTFSNMSNLKLFNNSIVSCFETVNNTAIESHSLEITYNSFSNYSILCLIIVVIIPLAFIGFGLAHWLKRRKL